jgi:hypothetical protein
MKYTQAYPDARSYRTKAVVNFSDLCMIYGYTTADGRYSRSSHDLDFDEEVQGVNMGMLFSFFFCHGGLALLLGLNMISLIFCLMASSIMLI